MALEGQVLYVTEAGLKEIKDELEHLITVKREEISVRLAKAIAQGDLKENADYHTAKEDQAFLELRIRELKDSLGRAELIKDSGPSDRVRVGSTVTVQEEGYDEEETFHIVGAHEADPSKGRISNESPFGRALIGAKRGQVVSAQVPAGIVRLRVIGIA
jgi:transcription elongation factor GreA